MAQKLVLLGSDQITATIFGARDENIDKIERAFSVRISNRHPENSDGDALLVEGDTQSSVERAAVAITCLARMADAGGTLVEQSVDYVVSMVADGMKPSLAHWMMMSCV